MSNTSQRTVVVLALSVGLLLAAVSGGATYAAFTDSGSVDVTFTAGNITDSSEGTPTGDTVDDPTDPDSETDDDTNESNEPANESESVSNESNEPANETIKNESEQISNGDIPTPNGPENDRTSDPISAEAAIAVEYRTVTTGQLSIDG